MAFKLNAMALMSIAILAIEDLPIFWQYRPMNGITRVSRRIVYERLVVGKQEADAACAERNLPPYSSWAGPFGLQRFEDHLYWPWGKLYVSHSYAQHVSHHGNRELPL
jgi:hypothetical protein